MMLRRMERSSSSSSAKRFHPLTRSSSALDSSDERRGRSTDAGRYSHHRHRPGSRYGEEYGGGSRYGEEYGGGSRYGEEHGGGSRYGDERNYSLGSQLGDVHNLWTTVDMTPHREKLKKKLRHGNYRVVRT